MDSFYGIRTYVCLFMVSDFFKARKVLLGLAEVSSVVRLFRALFIWHKDRG